MIYEKSKHHTQTEKKKSESLIEIGVKRYFQIKRISIKLDIQYENFIINVLKAKWWERFWSIGYNLKKICFIEFYF